MTLVPEKRTDKNGVTSTRWVKPSTAVETAHSLPQPQVAIQQLPQVSNETLLNLMVSERFKRGLHESQLPDLNSGLDLIREDDPSILALAEELMTSGSGRARSIAAEHLYGMALGITEAIRKVRDEPQYYPDGWQAECVWGQEVKSALISGWSLGSVMDETETVTNDDEEEFDIVDHIKEIHSDLSGDNRELYERQDLPYWRGVAALGIAYHAGVTGYNVDVLRFVEWAGAHEDIKYVIDSVKERRTVNPEHIEDRTIPTPMLRGML